MDKTKIDQTVYDRYIDASAALLTEVACQPLTEEIHRKFGEPQVYGIPFPESLDKRCRATIRKEFAARKRKKRRKILLKSLSGIACGLVVVLVLAGVLFKHVEAIRAPVINYLISENKGYLQISGKPSGEQEKPKTVNWEDPLAGLLPKGYNLTSLDEFGSDSVAIYKNLQDDSIYLSTSSISGVTRVDVDDPEKVRKVNIGIYEGPLIENNNSVTVVWIYENAETQFVLVATNLTTDEILAIARQFQELLDS